MALPPPYIYLPTILRYFDVVPQTPPVPPKYKNKKKTRLRIFSVYSNDIFEENLQETVVSHLFEVV